MLNLINNKEIINPYPDYVKHVSFPSLLERKDKNRILNTAKSAKNDEFYTQYQDIEKEVSAYIDFNPDTFLNKTVYCNCDDPYESNFFRFFVNNFNKLGIKKLISSGYEGSPLARSRYHKGFAIIVDHVIDTLLDWTNIKSVLNHIHAEYIPLRPDGDYLSGDFRSQDSINLLQQADIIVTNPPFSLFREYISQLIEYGKRFLIIGNKNAITYKEVFPLIKNNKIWVGTRPFSGGMWFIADYIGKYEKIVNGVRLINVPAIWFTNLDHGHRHKWLQLKTLEENIRFNKKLNRRGYIQYDNYNAIDVPFTDAIPSDYDGVMGVPISFLDKYNPEQFEILGIDTDIKEGRLPALIKNSWQGKLDRGYINGKRIYSRLFIRLRR